MPEVKAAKPDTGKRAYELRIDYTQVTGDRDDHETVSRDYSDDPLTHVIKAAVFSEELAEAEKRIARRLANIAIEALGGQVPAG